MMEFLAAPKIIERRGAETLRIKFWRSQKNSAPLRLRVQFPEKLSLWKLNDMKNLLLLFLPLLFFQCRNKPAETPPAEPPNPTEVAHVDTPEVEVPVVETPAPPDFDTTIWEEVVRLDEGIGLDLRYATDNNFVEEKMYDCGRCFLRPDVAREVAKIQQELQAKGYGLKMFDCYRPRPIQWKLWNKVPDPRYVADPRKGSMHNRGMAVDLTIVDSEGKELDMGTDFDFFGKEAYHNYTAHSAEIAANRKLLLSTMEAHHFRPTSTEWWHYSWKPKKWEIADWLWECEK